MNHLKISSINNIIFPHIKDELQNIFIGIKNPDKIRAGYPLPLTIGFDFDGVIAAPDSEKILMESTLNRYIEYEQKMAHNPLPPGPMCRTAKKFLALKYMLTIYTGRRDLVKLYLITARSSKVAGRVITTLKSCNLFFDEMFFLSGESKEPVIKTIQPDIYIDDKFENMKWYLSGTVIGFTLFK